MYNCNHCDFESDSETGLKIHTSQMHKGSQKKTYSCTNCGDTFEDYPSRREGRGREDFFCSKSCKNAYEQVEKIDTTCSWCGADIEKYPSTMGEMGEYSIDNHFCGKDCESQHKQTHWVGEDHPLWNGGKEEVVCEECGDTYRVTPSITDQSWFCSKDCYDSNQTDEKIVLECDWCDEEFKRKSHNIKGESVFCSSGCFERWMSEQRRGDGNPQWVGGKEEYYGENWNAERRKALSDAGYKCTLCDMSREEHYSKYGYDLDVHHRIPLRTFDEAEDANFQNNLVVCCKNCHHSVLEQKPVPHNEVRAPV